MLHTVCFTQLYIICLSVFLSCWRINVFSSCLHYLIPDKRDSVIIDRLRHAKTFKSLMIRTEKSRNSLTAYCLNHYDYHSCCKPCILLTNCCHKHWKITSSLFYTFVVFVVLIQLLLLHEVNHYLLFKSPLCQLQSPGGAAIPTVHSRQSGLQRTSLDLGSGMDCPMKLFRHRHFQVFGADSNLSTFSSRTQTLLSNSALDSTVVLVVVFIT